MDEFMPVLADHLPDRLIDAECWPALRKAASRLPADMGRSLFGFELSLVDAAPGADFLACACRAEKGETHLCGLPWSEPGWQPIRDLAARWRDGLELDDLWLEFDVRRGQCDEASIFFGPRPVAWPDAWSPTVKALEHFQTTEAVQSLGRCLEDRLETLGFPVTLFQVGVMARSGGPIRVCLGVKTPSQAAGLLDCLERPDLTERLGELDLPEAPIAVDLDVIAGQIQPRIGLELVGFTTRGPRLDPAQANLLAQLESKGWVRPEKIGALALCPTHLRAYQHLDLWPESLDAGKALFSERRLSNLLVYLHHVKLTYGGPGAPDVKAYLAVSHLWQELP